MLVKNVNTNVGRIGRVVVLDPPNAQHPECRDQTKSPNLSTFVMAVLPSYGFPSNDNLNLDREVAFLSPLLAFNLGLHISCLKVLVQGGPESLKSLFEIKGVSDENMIKDSAVCVEILSWSHLPRYASHLRVSFVKIPECGMLESLKGSSLIEDEDRQELIDLALHHYFRVDRYLARGDVFCIPLNWNCNSEMCIACSKKASGSASGVIIHFRVCLQYLLLLLLLLDG